MPFKHYQEANFFLPYVHLLPCDTMPPQTQDHSFRPHSPALRLVLSSDTCLQITEKKGRQSPRRDNHAGRRDRNPWLQATPNQNPLKTLRNKARYPLSVSQSLTEEKFPENLRQLSEGREQGLRRSTQHSLRRNHTALTHEQWPQQSLEPL